MGRILSALRSILVEDTGERVHFHRGPNGHPAVCEVSRCDRPELSID